MQRYKKNISKFGSLIEILINITIFASPSIFYKMLAIAPLLPLDSFSNLK
jgi:hypothetical protein